MKTGEVVAGRFRVTGPSIGRGASGVVWPAQELGTHRQVVLKQLHEHLASDPLALAKFRAEATAAGRLQHPHILGVIGLWRHQGEDVLVSVRSDGAPVHTLSALQGDQALRLAHQLASALAAAHTSGQIHGDVRPGNVLWAADGAKLFDFGVATLLARSGLDQTPRFRPGETAPEVQQGAPVSVRSDLYGLGIVLFRVLYGRAPYEGVTPFDLIGQQRKSPPNVEAQPEGVASLLRDLLHPDPVHRPGSAQAVCDALERLQRWPNRAVFLGKNRLAPTRLQRPWVVHGIDPSTGAPAVFAAGLSGRASRSLVHRLCSEGWEATRTKEALSLVDVLFAAALGVALALPLNIPGALLGIALGLVWRSRRVEHRIRDALPPLSAPMPPIVQPAGNEVALTAGLLMMVMVPLLMWWPILAVPPALLLGALAVSSWRGSDNERTSVLTARVNLAIAETERLIGQRKIDLDAQLALQGECNEVEKAWRGGGLNADEALLRVEALTARVRSLPGST